jgi:phosphoadenosine phosphosulfate reductase
VLIENTLLGEIDRVKIAIDRLKQFEPKDRPYILAFSGGKDSIACYYLMKMAGVKFKAIYSSPSVDPPELRYFIRENFPDVIIQPYQKDKEGNLITMWTLIPKKLFPPNRMVRYCCDVLKERTGGEGDSVVLGVRWSESNGRSKLPMVGFWKGKIVVRPIIDWKDEDVWEFIKTNNLPYCKLYDEGQKRIGCIGCPLNPKSQKEELEKFPKFRELYIRAFERMLEERKRRGKETQWKTGEEVMEWWLMENVKLNKQEEGQCSFFGE